MESSVTTQTKTTAGSKQQLRRDVLPVALALPLSLTTVMCSHAPGPITKTHLSESDFLWVVQRAPEFQKPISLRFHHQMGTIDNYGAPCRPSYENQQTLIDIGLAQLQNGSGTNCRIVLTPEGARISAADPQAVPAEPPREGVNSPIPGRAGRFNIVAGQIRFLKVLEFVDGGSGTAVGKFAFTIEPSDDSLLKRLLADETRADQLKRKFQFGVPKAGMAEVARHPEKGWAVTKISTDDYTTLSSW